MVKELGPDFGPHTLVEAVLEFDRLRSSSDTRFLGGEGGGKPGQKSTVKKPSTWRAPRGG